MFSRKHFPGVAQDHKLFSIREVPTPVPENPPNEELNDTINKSRILVREKKKGFPSRLVRAEREEVEGACGPKPPRRLVSIVFPSE